MTENQYRSTSTSIGERIRVQCKLQCEKQCSMACVCGGSNDSGQAGSLDNLNLQVKTSAGDELKCGWNLACGGNRLLIVARV